MTPGEPEAPAASLVILAGGASRRMGGGQKALLRVGDREVLDRLLDGPGRDFQDIVLAAPPSSALAEALERFGWIGRPEAFRRTADGARLRIVPDRRPGRGPLAGLETALPAARAERAWVLACDLPFMVAEVGRILLSALEEGGDGEVAGREAAVRAQAETAPPRAVVPYVDGRLQPLCAAYQRWAAGRARKLLDADRRRTTEWLEELAVTRLPASAFQSAGDPERLFLNLNEPADLARAGRLA